MSQNQQSEIIFADGFIFKKKDNAPDFVVGQLSISVEDAIQFIGQHERNGWVNLDIKQSRAGKYYIELNQFVPKNQQAEKSTQTRPASKKELVDRYNQPEVDDNQDDDTPF